MSTPQVICLTPVKDEAWILDRFLACASEWADRIIIADQGSTDGSREICARYPKVQIIENTATEYGELGRRAMLVEEARKTPGPKLLVGIDADEMLSANWKDSAEWQAALRLPPGTIVASDWLSILPDFRRAVPGWELWFGYMDDGAPYVGPQLHGPRVPRGSGGAPSLRLRDIKVLHYQFTDPDRTASKLRWYQCWETVKGTSNPLGCYRAYHPLNNAAVREAIPLEHKWLRGYEDRGIDMTTVHRPTAYRWDGEVAAMFRDHGVEKFARLDIWNNAPPTPRETDPNPAPGTFAPDPRGAMTKLIHRWLARTQGRPRSTSVRIVERLLRQAGW